MSGGIEIAGGARYQRRVGVASKTYPHIKVTLLVVDNIRYNVEHATGSLDDGGVTTSARQYMILGKTILKALEYRVAVISHYEEYPNWSIEWLYILQTGGNN